MEHPILVIANVLLIAVSLALAYSIIKKTNHRATITAPPSNEANTRSQPKTRPVTPTPVIEAPPSLIRHSERNERLTSRFVDERLTHGNTPDPTPLQHEHDPHDIIDLIDENDRLVTNRESSLPVTFDIYKQTVGNQMTYLCVQSYPSGQLLLLDTEQGHAVWHPALQPPHNNIGIVGQVEGRFPEPHDLAFETENGAMARLAYIGDTIEKIMLVTVDTEQETVTVKSKEGELVSEFPFESPPN